MGVFRTFSSIFYYININEIPSELSRENLISSHVKITCYLHMWKYHHCYGFIINRTFQTKNFLSKMVWHFIGVYIINRILHGRLEIRNFSSRVQKNISLFRYAHSCNIFQHSKRNFVSPRGHVISSICIPLIYIYSLLFLRYIVKPMRTTLSCFETSRIYFTCVYFFVPTLANQSLISKQNLQS